MSGNDQQKKEHDLTMETAMTIVPSDNTVSKPDDAPMATEMTMVDAAAVPEAGKSAGSHYKTEMTMIQDIPGEKPEQEINKTTPCQPHSGSYGNLQPGDRIDRCVIVKKLGQGGMGSVYLARHETLGIFRAIKVLSGALYIRGGEFIRRFIQEAKIACSINHPNIVNVLDVGEDKERNFCYIIMEYVDGGTVMDVLRKTPRLTETDALIITEAVAEALQAAAEQKIVHRDIKPDNIMLTLRGEVKLADLGIARNTDENVQLTKSHVMMGTPAYLAPEQAQDAHSVDVRADIYSLGATLYEMLTGQIPYPGKNTYDILAKLVSEPVPDPRSVVDNISAPTARLVMRMLAKNAKQRPDNAEELLKEIRGLHVVPADLDKGKSIRELLELSGAGNYSKVTRTASASGNSLSDWMMRHILLKLEFLFQKLPLISAGIDVIRKSKPVFYVLLTAVLIIGIGIPLSLYFKSASSDPEKTQPETMDQTASVPDTEMPQEEESQEKPLQKISTSPAEPEERPQETVSSAPASKPESEPKPDPAQLQQQQKQRMEEQRIREQKIQAEKARRESEKKRIAAEKAKRTKKTVPVRAGKISVSAEITPAGSKAVLYLDNGREVMRRTVPEEGKLQFQLPPGQYRLQVSAPGYKTAARSFPVSDSRMISCVKIDLAREMTRCVMQFYGSVKLLDYLRKQGLELRIDRAPAKKIFKFPHHCELTRQNHRIEVKEKGIHSLVQTVKIPSEKTEIQLEFYLTGKEASAEIATTIRKKIEINLFGVWEPLKKRIPLQAFHAYELKWRVIGEQTEETVSIPELMPETVHKITLSEKKQVDLPGKAEFTEAEKLLKEGSGRAATEKLKLADKAGHPEAACLLGELAEQGVGRWFSSDEDALVYYKRAASPPFNHPRAQLKLGIFHEQGRGGLEKDLKTALKWYKKAAAQKNPDALYRLGLAYKNGDGDEPVDYGKMMHFFAESAEQGHVEAQYQTGYGYENGIGVPINVEKAKYWYQKASASGHGPARSRGKALEDLK